MKEKIDVLTHSSIRIRSDQGTIYADPFRLREGRHDADYILVTHDHFDHFSPEDIRKAAKSATVLIVPENMADKAQEVKGAVGRIVTVRPGESIMIEGLEIEVIPAYNKLKPFHPKSAGWAGYVVNADGWRIYIAGDTDDTKEARAVKCDIALIPIGGTYTMDYKSAAKLVNAIKPALVIPTHYGSVAGKPEDAKAFAKLVEEPVKVEIKMQY